MFALCACLCDCLFVCCAAVCCFAKFVWCRCFGAALLLCSVVVLLCLRVFVLCLMFGLFVCEFDGYVDLLIVALCL